MSKKISVSGTKFLHETTYVSFEIIESANKNILVLSARSGKEYITTSLTKADLQLLLEFLKLRGIE